MNKRNTKQKEIILQAITANYNHPTIKEICNMVEDIDSSIGQATVYRNVKKLEKNSRIRKIITPGDVCHYDGNLEKHAHFICKKCHKIIDVFIDYTNSNEELEKNYSLLVENVSIIYEGLCKECK